MFKNYSLLLIILSFTPLISSYGQPYLSERHPDYQGVKEVFDKVWAAFGNYRTPPDLVIKVALSGEASIARYYSAPGRINPTVEIDSKLVSYLRDAFDGEFEDALACIIAHELAHHHLQHSGTSGSGSESASIHQEREADKIGFFFAYLAGYKSFPIAERLFDTLYEKYGLEKKAAREYPPKRERIRTARQQIGEIQALAHLYEAGKALMLTGKTAEATACFESIDTKLTAPEIKNNLGICYLLLCIDSELVTAGDMPFILPFEMDMSRRLILNARSLSVADQQEKRVLLGKAERAFLQAQMTGAHPGTGLNLAITYLLMENALAALGKIRQLGLDGHEAMLVRGIAYLKNGQRAEAAKDFRRLEGLDEPLFIKNKEVYKQVLAKGWKGVVPEVPDKESPLRFLFREKIPDESMSMPAFPVSDHPFPVAISHSTAGKTYRFRLPGNRGRPGDNWVIAHVSSSGRENQKQVKIGAAENQLTGRTGYGFPDRILKDVSGTRYYHYQTAQVVFVVENGKVKGWYVYDGTR